MSQGIYIGIDIGGTKLMVAAFSSKFELLRRERSDTPLSLEAGLTLIAKLISSVAQSDKIRAIGAACGGPLNASTGVVSPLHMPMWREVPLRKFMQEKFGAPFFVDVDTNAATLAEYRFGEHRADRLLYITVSTGLGGGLIVDGQIYRGGGGSHPEVGHQSVLAQLPKPGPIKCLCGANNCLEAMVSGRAIENLYQKQAKDLSASEWDQVAANLGQGIRNMAVLYAPTVVVLGGGVALGGGQRLLEGIQSVLADNLKIVPVPKVVFSSLGYDTALWGALALAIADSN